MPGDLDHRDRRGLQHAGGSFSADQSAAGDRGHVLHRNAAPGYRDRYHLAAGTFLYPGKWHRAYRIAFAAGRQHDPRVFPAGHGPGLGCHAAFESRPGRSEAPAARHAAAGGAEVGCIQSAGLSRRRQRRRPDRVAASRLRTDRDPESDRGDQGRRNSAALRRQIPANHGVRRPVQDALAPAQPDGCRDRGEQPEPHPAGRRRQDRPVRLLRLFEQPGRHHDGTGRTSR